VKYLPLIWAGLARKPLRSVLTLLSIAVAFVLFGVLHGVDASFDGALAKLSETRLRVMNRANLLEPMPIAYLPRIARIDGVEAVTPFAILIGYYQEPKNGINATADDPSTFVTVFPEIKIPADQFDAWRRTRNGAIVGSVLAQRYGWTIGDRVTLHAVNWVKRDGSPEWEFEIVGVCNAGPHDNKVFANEMFFNYDYLDAARADGVGMVHQFAVTVRDVSIAGRVADAIDREFANSAAETTTLNDREYVRSQIRQVGNVRAFINAIIGAVLFTLLYLAGNTMLQSVRDRIPEFGVLKTLGFSDRAMWLTVVAEALVWCTAGAGLGLGIAALVFPNVFTSLGFGVIALPWPVVVQGIALAALLAFITATWPALTVRRLTIVAALSGR
jgi:putative ABC transport system permease protein